VVPHGLPPLHAFLESEAKQEQIEAVSPPCTSLDDIRRTLTAGRRLADDAAQAVGARAVALGTSALPATSHLAAHPRYHQMMNQFGLTMKEQLTCGLHVHVSIASPEEGVAVLDRIRPWLPVLLALSSNSPMWMGDDSGYSSYRYQAWGRWPSAGAYDLFGSPEGYLRRVASLVTTGVLLDEGMVYFDARLCNHYPTIEIRVADVCMEVEHAVALAALARALVDTAAQEWQEGVPPHQVSTAELRLAMWAASRFATDGQLVHPATGGPCSAHEAIDTLLDHVQASLSRSGDLATTERTVHDILETGTGSSRQRRTFRQLRSARSVVMEAIEYTHSTSVTPAVGALA
jgi:carboxylate-amine ligase